MWGAIKYPSTTKIPEEETNSSQSVGHPLGSNPLGIVIGVMENVYEMWGFNKSEK